VLLAGLGVAALSACRRGPEPAAVGTPALAPPVVEPITAEGLKREIGQGGAAATVVNVWATWCLPCREEFPDLLQVEREYRQRGVRLVLVSADFPDRRGEVERFLSQHGVTFRSYLKDSPDMAFINALSPEWSGALPGTFVFDRAGVLRWFTEGKVTFQELREAVDKVVQAEHGEGGQG